MAAPRTKESLLDLLKVNGIEATTYDHPKVSTVEEQAKHVGHLKGGHSKNLLLKDKKNRLILVSALTSSKIDMKALSQRLGLGKSGLRMAPEDTMQAALKVPLGCVTPFALVNESARSVTLLLDEGFKSKSQVFFHPLSNDATTAVSPTGLDNFLRAIGREPVYVDIEAVVVVGKDQPPDLASYLVDPAVKEVANKQNVSEDLLVEADQSVKADQSEFVQEVHDGAAKSTVKLKSKSNSMTLVPKVSGANVQTTSTSILDELICAIQKEASKSGAEATAIMSGPLRQSLATELESMLMAFKNTAYTEGFVAGIASCSASR